MSFQDNPEKKNGDLADVLAGKSCRWPDRSGRVGGPARLRGQVPFPRMVVNVGAAYRTNPMSTGPLKGAFTVVELLRGKEVGQRYDSVHHPVSYIEGFIRRLGAEEFRGIWIERGMQRYWVHPGNVEAGVWPDHLWALVGKPGRGGTGTPRCGAPAVTAPID